MDDLKGLIRSLNKREVELVRLIYSKNLNSEEKQRLKLFNALVRNLKSSDKEILELLNYGGTGSAFSHLKKRLRNDILNVILLQETRKKFRAKLFSESIEVKKSMLFAELLYRRGVNDLADKIIDEAVKVSEKFEFLAEGYILIENQRVRQGITKGPKVISKFNQKVDYYIESLQALSSSISMFYDFTVRNFNKSNIDIEILEEEFGFLKRLEKNYLEFPYAKNGYWFHRASIFYFNHLLNYDKSIEHGKKLLKLIQESPAVYSPVVYAGTLKEIGEISISGKKFNEAIGFLSEALTLFNPELNNYLLTLESIFITYFHLGDLLEAEMIIERAKKHPNFKSRKIVQARWTYFEACLIYKKGDYSSSFEKLGEFSTVLIADKGELQIGYRLLYLYLIFKLGKLDLFEFELLSFNRIIRKLKGVKIERTIVILKLLKILVRSDFIINKGLSNVKQALSKLEDDDNCKWSPIGFELVSFESFFIEL
jgi:tetratricopeptide (TPR) repeat protein